MIVETSPVAMVAALASAVSTGALLRWLAPPPRRLSSRVGPYVAPHLAPSRPPATGVFASVFGPIVRAAADRLGSMVDRAGGEATVLKLRQAGWHRGLGEQEMIGAYRVDQLRATAVGGIVSATSSWAIGATPLVFGLLVGLGLVVGGTRTRGRLEKAIERRREQMTIEIYTVNQLLAMRVRAGGGVMNAVKSIVQRGSGEVVAELDEALRLHRAGWSGPDAFRRIAELSPEPFCARTYRILASAEERGADLAGALLSLSEDVRETRRESIKRTATKRRAAMLVPTIAILAPVLILFVAAPLPYLITSWR